jgi:hypothetical protein
MVVSRESLQFSSVIFATGYRLRFVRTWAKPLTNRGDFVNPVKDVLTLRRRGWIEETWVDFAHL